MKNNNKRKGFTLVELLVVIAILAILATVSVVGYTSFIERARKSNAVTEATQIREFLRASLLDCQVNNDKYVLATETTTSGNTTTTNEVTIDPDDGKISSSSITAITSSNAADSELKELLTGGKKLVVANEGTTVTYHYVDDTYAYDVVIKLTDFSTELEAVTCTHSGN